jgi:hypothetical protein
MTTFETDGFLSADIVGAERAIAARYQRKLELATETNRLTHRVIYSVKPHSEHVTELLLAALLTRQAAAFQAFLILLGKGLETQAQIILRNLAEMMFITGAIGKDKTFADKYVLSEEVSRLKTLEAIAKDQQCRGERVDGDTTRLIEELRAQTKGKRPETFTAARMAEIAGLSSYYDNLYRLTSMAVHASPRELNTAFVVDGEGNLVSMRYEPVVDDLDLYLDYAISVMLYSLHEMATHFGLGLVGDIEKVQQINQQLAGPGGQAGS